VIKIEGLNKSYGGDFVLDIPSLEFREATITAVLGPNGAGKSTLLGIIAGIETADRGTISLDGMVLRAGDDAGVSWRRAVTMVAQKPFLFIGTVSDNVGYGLKVRRVPRARRETKIRDVLAHAGLDGYESRPARTLSGGEAQLVALARALVLEPRVLLLDEQTAHIDRDNAGRIEGLISSLGGSGDLTVICATHNHDQAYRLSGRVLSLMGGTIVEAPPENVFRGTAEESGEGLKLVTLRNGVRLEADTPLSGHVHLSIDPAAIIVSHGRITSSARNSFEGRLVAAAVCGHRVRLTVDAGVEFSVLVTEASFRDMGLQPGDPVHLTFKTTAVKVF
jgi:tungstate transport system ATP-binding protein